MIERKQTPPKFRDYRRYKPYLRTDFDHRCAYCGITEYRWGSERNFVVEHFRPRSRFRRLALTYSNLYYACNRCNDIKGYRWPSSAEVSWGHHWTDPCACDLTDHMREQDDGMLEPLTAPGGYTIANLMLNLREYLVTWRRERRQLLADVNDSMRILARLESAKMAALGPRGAEQLAFLIGVHRQLCDRLRREY